ncbi:MAG: SMR family transporter [Pseudomonadota bacterium]
MPVHYIYLFFAIIAENIGLTAMKASEQFTKLGPTLVCLISFGLALYLLGLTLKFMPIGIVYALWSGLGIVTIAAVGFFAFGQKLDWPAILGLVLIIAGIVIINLFSKSAVH